MIYLNVLKCTVVKVLLTVYNKTHKKEDFKGSIQHLELDPEIGLEPVYVANMFIWARINEQSS